MHLNHIKKKNPKKRHTHTFLQTHTHMINHTECSIPVWASSLKASVAPNPTSQCAIMQLSIWARACTDSLHMWVCYACLCDCGHNSNGKEWCPVSLKLLRAKLFRGLPVCPRRPRGRPLSLLLRNELLGNGPVSLRKQERVISRVSGKHSCKWGLQHRWWKGIKSGSTVGNVKKKEDSIKNMDGEVSYKWETQNDGKVEMQGGLLWLVQHL